MSKIKNIIYKIKRKLGEVCGAMQIGFSFYLIFLLAIILKEFRLYFLYVVFIVFHELSHFLVAKKLGYLPAKMKLTFFGASLEGYDDFYYRDEIKVVLAGPVFNFLVVIFCYLSFWFWPESFIVLNDVLEVNLAILLFNVLPVFPLDFGRVILAQISLKKDRKSAIKCVNMISFAVLIVLFCVFLISFIFDYNFTFGFVVLNLTVLHFSSSKGTSFKRDLYSFSKLKNLKKGLQERVVFVHENTPDFRLLSRLDSSFVTRFIFVDDEFNEVREMTEFEVLANFRK